MHSKDKVGEHIQGGTAQVGVGDNFKGKQSTAVCQSSGWMENEIDGTRHGSVRIDMAMNAAALANVIWRQQQQVERRRQLRRLKHISNSRGK